jgi:hypothetical protein
VEKYVLAVCERVFFFVLIVRPRQYTMFVLLFKLRHLVSAGIIRLRVVLLVSQFSGFVASFTVTVTVELEV